MSFVQAGSLSLLIISFAAGQSPTVPQSMLRFSRALGVQCDYCHVGEEWMNASKPPFGTAIKMEAMVKELNDGPLQPFGVLDCWTCHQGDKRPSRFPSASLATEMTKWPEELADAPQGVKLTMTVYRVSLGVSCEHCHVAADWKSSAKPEFETARKMSAMFETFPKYIDSKSFSMQCWTCHKGRPQPERLR
jgi:glutaredoxin